MTKILVKTYHTPRSNNIRTKKQYYDTRESEPGNKNVKERSRHHLNVKSLAENLKHETCWEKGELNSMILSKNEHRKELLVVLHSDTKIESFQTDQSLTMHIVEGLVRFRARHHTVSLHPGQYFTLSEKTKYSFTTIEDSTIILSIYSEYKPG